MLFSFLNQAFLSINLINIGLEIPLVHISNDEFTKDIVGTLVPIEILGDKHDCNVFMKQNKQSKIFKDKLIALISLDGCPLDAKIKYAIDNGALAIIIAYKEHNIDKFINYKVIFPEIPIFGIRNSYYSILRYLIENNELEKPQSLKKSSNPIENVVNLFSNSVIVKKNPSHELPIIIQIFLQLPTILTILVLVLLWKTFNSNEEELNSTMYSEYLEKLPFITYDGNIEELDYSTCSICLIEFKNNDKLRFLDCEHIFHKDCLDPWLRINNVCPICRKRAFKIDWDSLSIRELNGTIIYL